MNCGKFEELVRDLIRNSPMEVSERQAAMDHTRECGVCRIRLEDERALSGGLSALAKSNLHESASINVETSLRAAFNAAQAAGPASARLNRRKWMIVAAAAVLLVFVTLFVIKTRRENIAPTIAGVEKTEPKPVAPAPEAEKAVITSPPVNQPHKKRTTQLANLNPRVRPQPPVRNAAPSNTTAPAEIATSFIPLARPDDAKSVDSWRLVRAEVPKSSLTMFGLPVNWDSPEDRVTADFLVGNDGLAYAVRFVR